jgi:hypothetical protein
MLVQASHRVAIRVAVSDLERIDELAARHGLNSSQYLICAGLGELRDPAAHEQRLEAIEERLERLERAQFDRSW